MYPNPFTVSEPHEDIVSPVSPTAKKFSWQSEQVTWNASPGEYGFRVPDSHSHPSYVAQIVEPSESVQFQSVDWEARQQSGEEDQGVHSGSALSSVEEFRLPRGRDEEDGLGIHIADPGPEFDSEKASWEPTRPPPSSYRPNTSYRCEDVELNLQLHEKANSSAPRKKRACTENRGRVALWALVIMLPFVVLPVAIFGGVYRWGNAQGLCEAGGGAWEGSTNECQY